MNERICCVFVFSNCTTAPDTGVSSTSETTPCTLRVSGSPFFCAYTPPSRRRPPNTINNTRLMRPSSSYDVARAAGVPDHCSLPILVRFLFFFVFESFLFFVFFLGFIHRLEFQRIGSHHLQVLTAFVAAQRVA